MKYRRSRTRRRWGLVALLCIVALLLPAARRPTPARAVLRKNSRRLVKRPMPILFPSCIREFIPFIFTTQWDKIKPKSQVQATVVPISDRGKTGTLSC